MMYPGKESTTLEFKQEPPEKKQTVIKTVIAFANTYGGKIIIGVDDEGLICGINEQHVQHMHDDFTRAIYDSVAPTLFPSIYTQRFDDKLVMIIEITEGMNKPYHIASKEPSNSTYIRLGAHTMLASADSIQQLQWQGRRKFLDEIPVYNASEKDIDTTLFETFLRERRQKNRDVETQEMLYHYGILVKEGMRIHPTIGGLLLFGKQPNAFFPEAFVICTHFAGTTGRNVIATRDSTGHLLQQYRDTIAFILSRLNRSFKIVGADQRDEQLEIPVEAIREMVINAIVHRNYHITGPTKIAIYDDRLEIFSPGNFPGPIKMDKVDMGITYIRNTIITRVFRDYGIIEKLGSGFITLFDTYQQQGLPAPTVTEGVGFVKCILPRPNTLRAQPLAHDGLDTLIESLLTTQDTIKTSDIMKQLHVSRATASRLLTMLTHNGILQRCGKGSATHYRKA